MRGIGVPGDELAYQASMVLFMVMVVVVAVVMFVVMAVVMVMSWHDNDMTMT